MESVDTTVSLSTLASIRDEHLSLTSMQLNHKVHTQILNKAIKGTGTIKDVFQASEDSPSICVEVECGRLTFNLLIPSSAKRQLLKLNRKQGIQFEGVIEVVEINRRSFDLRDTL